MSDEAALLDVIRAQPDEDTPRLMYADWLDENGQPDRAEFIRSQIERARLARDDPRWRVLFNREAELVVAARQTWLHSYFLWGDWSNLLIRRGIVELATTTSTFLVPHLDSLRKLTSLLELRLRDLLRGQQAAIEDELARPPPEPARPRSWVERAWDKVARRERAAQPGRPNSTALLSPLCQVSLANRPRGLRIRAAISERSGRGSGLFALDLLAPGVDALEPPLHEGEWTVLAWSPDVPDEAQLLARLGRALGDRMRAAPPSFFHQRLAARPVRAVGEFAPWCPLALPGHGPYWLRFRNGAAVDCCTGFRPPADWLGGASL